MKDRAIDTERGDGGRDADSAGRDDSSRPLRADQDRVQLLQVVDLAGVESIELENGKPGVFAAADVLRERLRGAIRTLGAPESYVAAFARPRRTGSCGSSLT